MDVADYIDLETDISQRSEFIEDFFDRLDEVVWVLDKFCERADWLMSKECRISQLMADVHIAATEVEGVLKYAEVFDQSMGEMLLLSNSRELSQEYRDARKQLQSVLPRILPYCSNELRDMNKLLTVSDEENEPTKTLNRQLLRSTNILVQNFAQVISKLFFHIDNAYKRFAEVNDVQMKVIFEKQYERYYNDNIQMLDEYANEIDDVKEAKKELKELFSLPSLLTLYLRNASKPHLLIKQMRQACMFETNLIEIYAYMAKMEKIKNLKSPDNSSKTVINEVNNNKPEEEQKDVEVDNSSNIENSMLNFFAPKKVLKEMLLEDWFDIVCTNKELYHKEWREKLVDDLMESEYRTYIAEQWEHADKRPTIKGQFVGVLVWAGVLKGSNLAIARTILGISHNTRDEEEKKDANTFGKYIGQGKSEPYADWIKDHIDQMT